MRKCCFFDILFLYCFLEKRHVYILTGFQMVTKSKNRLAELRVCRNGSKSCSPRLCIIVPVPFVWDGLLYIYRCELILFFLHTGSPEPSDKE